ncbi:LysR family transcriptional regulator [Chromobacterium sinusclupearum]|uniref:LysR family transcriptional regulator n=1 Tax=Chromobacterium sinusclupearum TaxID=2077146 RepID=A0A2K4MSM5_9NEIS|nr:LysR substrate-binding domain-containing protein [Chromobacterium sinusclupearum]POB00084.1 LysR family transcriptional regulator [Chromobacterium sinusclupearum]
MATRAHDLNLLTVFDAVMQQGSVAKAAEKLELTPASVSLALSRLRDSLGKPLFVRKGRGIAPTLYAHQLHASVCEELYRIANALGMDDDFDPARSKRQFVLAGQSYFDQIFLAHCSAWSREAPGLRITFRAEEDNFHKPIEMLSERQADIYLGSLPINHPSILQQCVGEEELVVACSRSHPRIGGGLSLDQFFIENHATLTEGRCGSLYLYQLCDAPLPTRNVRYRSDSLLHVMAAAARSELLCVTTARLARLWEDTLALRILPLPFPLRRVPIYLSIHGSQGNDQGIQWLTAQLRNIFLDSPPAMVMR